MAVPVIDLLDPEAPRRIDEACRTWGFFSIVGHGVDDRVIAEAWDEMRAFFALPTTDKLAVHVPDHPYGYFPMASERLARSLGEETPPDLKESFNLGPHPRHDDGSGAFGSHDRLWPDEPAGLRAAWAEYYERLGELGDRLMRLFAVALDLPATHFDRYVDHPLHALRGLHYPPVARPLPGQLRAGPHTDYGTLTILLPGPGEGGLEIHQDGLWIRPECPDGGFVVNVGDLMVLWTQGRWRSTLHRVALPPDGHLDEDRYSMAFFHTPNWGAEVVPLETCTPAGAVAATQPVLAGPWLQAKFEAAYTGG
ncbi:MAG: 2-oxoglutarate and iron-dependent oxygenase domain-containing protein [Actinomycetota bacterium]